MTITLPFLSVRHAYETNIVEENGRLLPPDRHSVRVVVGPFGLLTLRQAADL